MGSFKSDLRIFLPNLNGQLQAAFTLACLIYYTRSNEWSLRACGHCLISRARAMTDFVFRAASTSEKFNWRAESTWSSIWSYLVHFPILCVPFFLTGTSIGSTMRNVLNSTNHC